MAEEALKINGGNTFTDMEIDMMLPDTLKRRGKMSSYVKKNTVKQFHQT